MTTRQLHLNTNLTNVGRHPAAWQTRENPLDFVSLDFYTEVATVAERGTLDAIFLPDGIRLGQEFATGPWQSLEPTALLSALAARTTHIGLVGTLSATFNEPWNLARRVASLDRISGGRAGWNIVTTFHPDSALQFGLDAVPAHALRYERATEFVDVVTELWDSFAPDAIVADGARFVDPDRIREVRHDGPHYRLTGSLPIPRSPQGRPILVQAGSSDAGRDLAATRADVVFTAQPDLEAARRYYESIKSIASAYGRNPDHVKVLPGLFPVIGSTEEEARRRKQRSDELIDLESERIQLAGELGLDESFVVLDEPLPADLVEHDDPAFTGSKGIAATILRRSAATNYTVRELLLTNPTAHPNLVGAPEQIADEIELWFRSGAADGFNVNADVFPDGLELFVDHVVPILRKRGIFRHEYTGTTLREHLGIPQPPSGWEK